MKIAFLCTSAAPGRDGVGDYTRRLAHACADQGHECRLLALNDRQAVHSSTEMFAGQGMMTTWPATQPWSVRSGSICAALEQFAPDWISWQMVSYGYHAKGILGPEIIDLAQKLRGWRSHVMLHEIWIGVARGDSWWSRYIGWRQRRALLAPADIAGSGAPRPPRVSCRCSPTAITGTRCCSPSAGSGRTDRGSSAS